jgi:hypothetical protein
MFSVVLTALVCVADVADCISAGTPCDAGPSGSVPTGICTSIDVVGGGPNSRDAVPVAGPLSCCAM